MEAIVQSSPIIHLLFFPCGAFLSEKPRKIFLQMNARAADGRMQRLFPGRVYGFLFWFSFLSPERKENKFFLRVNQTPLTGGRSGPAQAGLWLSLWFSFRLRKEKRT